MHIVLQHRRPKIGKRVQCVMYDHLKQSGMVSLNCTMFGFYPSVLCYNSEANIKYHLALNIFEPIPKGPIHISILVL